MSDPWNPSWIRWRWAQARTVSSELWSCARNAFRIHLGNRVWYQGREWLVVNGVNPGKWDLIDAQSRERVLAPRAEVRRKRNLREVRHALRAHWHWLHGYWFHINVGKRLGLNGAYYGRRR